MGNVPTPISSMTVFHTLSAMVAAASHASATLAYSAGKSSKCQPNCAYGSAEAASEECDRLPLPAKSSIMLRALRPPTTVGSPVHMASLRCVQAAMPEDACGSSMSLPIHACNICLW